MNIELEFQRLARVWRDETEGNRRSMYLFVHPASAQILALGVPAIPFVCRELERLPDLRWLGILQALIGRRPDIQEGVYEKDELIGFWLAWAKEHEYY